MRGRGDLDGAGLADADGAGEADGVADGCALTTMWRVVRVDTFVGGTASRPVALERRAEAFATAA
tara:strand:- start:124 stop:318 length:195 start_codon:yes stop_codon:yes gene_type:complete